MALSYTRIKNSDLGRLWVRLVDITAGAGDYLAGGYVLDPKMLGFGVNGTILGAIPLTSNGFILEFVSATNAIRIRDASGGVGAATPEVANALAALNGLTFRLLVLGLGSPG
jgi:hypothetical protein